MHLRMQRYVCYALECGPRPSLTSNICWQPDGCVQMPQSSIVKDTLIQNSQKTVQDGALSFEDLVQEPNAGLDAAGSGPGAVQREV